MAQFDTRTAHRAGLRLFSSLTLLLSLLSSLAAAEAPDRFAEQLAPVREKAAQMPRLYSLLVQYQGELVVEDYFNDRDRDDIANIKSASKSILSALVGAAIDRGHLKGVEQTLGDFFPQRLAGEENAVKRTITIEDLLTMRSGLETTSRYNYGRWVLSDNWVDFVLNQPLQQSPGKAMDYSTGNTHLLSAILVKATGTSTLEFAREVLARPLGFHLADWPTDPQGIHFGGNDMEMTPRQMLRVGEMYLNDGVYEGRRVLPAQWVERSLTPHTLSPRHNGERAYGYGWWLSNLAGYPAAFAWGYGGQFIVLVEDLDLVIVTTSSSYPGEGRRQHTRAIYNLVEHELIARIGQLHEQAQE